MLCPTDATTESVTASVQSSYWSQLGWSIRKSRFVEISQFFEFLNCPYYFHISLYHCQPPMSELQWAVPPSNYIPNRLASVCLCNTPYSELLRIQSQVPSCVSSTMSECSAILEPLRVGVHTSHSLEWTLRHVKSNRWWCPCVRAWHLHKLDQR